MITTFILASALGAAAGALRGLSLNLSRRVPGRLSVRGLISRAVATMRQPLEY